MYRSAITSYCTVASLRWFKKKGNPVDNLDYDDFVQYVGNKTVYDDESLQQSYSKKQVCAITLVYNGFFGSGSNVNCAWLKDNHLMDDHPYRIAYDRDEVLMILAEGGVDEKFAFVDKA